MEKRPGAFFCGATQNRRYAVYCPYNAILLEADMKSVNVEEHMKRVVTQEEHDAKMAHFRWVCEEIDKANAESPLPDDFIDYCKGRKFFHQAAPQ
jgi:hypothetical protein